MPTNANIELLNFEKPYLQSVYSAYISLEQKIKKTDTPLSLREKRMLSLYQRRVEKNIKFLYKSLEPWQIIEVARSPQRPQFLDYANSIFNSFIPLMGDRDGHEEKNLIGGFAEIDQHKVMIIGQHRGHSAKEMVKVYNGGMVSPAGYKKAMRLMHLANQYHLPIITFVDTPGAYPSVEAEEKGQGYVIAKNLMEMSHLSVPILSIILGEGGSGGALAISVNNKLLMLEYSIFSVISPEGAASILWRDSNYYKDAARVMKITSYDLQKLGIVDEIIPEPLGGAHRDYETIQSYVKQAILKNLNEFRTMTKDEIIKQKQEKYLQYGFYK